MELAKWYITNPNIFSFRVDIRLTISGNLDFSTANVPLIIHRRNSRFLSGARFASDLAIALDSRLTEFSCASRYSSSKRSMLLLDTLRSSVSMLLTLLLCALSSRRISNSHNFRVAFSTFDDDDDIRDLVRDRVAIGSLSIRSLPSRVIRLACSRDCRIRRLYLGGRFACSRFATASDLVFFLV